MLETIKSYLVSLGFSVDKNSYNEATKVMDSAGESVSKFAGSAVTKFAGAGVAVASFALTATLGLAKFVDSLGNAQIENEKLARQMWITQDNAMAFSASLKALHANLQDLYMSPTLMEQFQQLREEAFTLQAPAEYKQQMQMIQSISFEFKRMKLEGTYALQWIGYYFIKYMAGPIGDIKIDLAEINDKIIKTMPNWTKVVAQVMSWFAQFGITTVRAIKDTGRAVDDIGQSIPTNLKLIGAAVTALGLIIETGPLGIMIAIFTAAILLLNDFYTYLDGGESAFGPFWQKLIDLYNKFTDAGSSIDELKKKIKEAFKEAGDFVDGAEKKLDNFWNALRDNGALDNFSKTFSNEMGIASDELQTVEGWVKQIWSSLQKSGVSDELLKDFENLVGLVAQFAAQVTGAEKKLLELKGTQEVLKVIGDILGGVIVAALQTIDNLLKSMGDGIKGMSYLMKGDFKDALKSFGSMVTDQFKLPTSFTPSYIFPNSPNNQSNTNNKVTLNQTNNIYGSDPKSTANAAHDNFESMYFRNFKGVIT